MKTVQDYLSAADRSRLLDAIAYDKICDPILLLEYQDKSVSEIQKACKIKMNRMIEYLLSLKVVQSDSRVLYMARVSSVASNINSGNLSLCLVDLNEIREDIYAPGYSLEFSDWQETLGYLVADNKLTQDHMNELLTQYLHEVAYFGTDPEMHRENVKKAFADIDKGLKEIEDGLVVPAEEVFEDLRRKHGFPLDEKDKMMDELRSKITEAEYNYSRYSNWRERSRILESLGETAPPYERSNM